jgi:hypothetical protein
MSSMGHRGVAVLIWGVVILSLASVAQPCRGQVCGEWQPLDIPDLTPGVRGEVHALVVHDDGTGRRCMWAARSWSWILRVSWSADWLVCVTASGRGCGTGSTMSTR